MGAVLRFVDPHGTMRSTLTEAVATRPPLNLASLGARIVFDPPQPTAVSTIYRDVTESVTHVDDALPMPDAPRAIGQAAERLREAMEAAIHGAMGTARTVAVLAGGGVDSAALLALALRRGRATGARVFAVALDYEARGDDRPHLSAIERALDVEVFRVSPEAGAAFVHAFDAGVDAAPFVWPTAVVEAALHARARAEGAEVVLSGGGGDELFDGEPRALASLLLRRPVTAVRRAFGLRAFPPQRHRIYEWLVRPALLGLVPRRVRRLRSRLRPTPAPPWAAPALRAEVATSEEQRIERRLGYVPPGPWESDHHHLIATIAYQLDWLAGIPSRRPFLERSLRRFVSSLDPTWLFADDVRRGLLRRAMRGLLPASVLDREDKAEWDSANRRFIAAIGGFGRLAPLADVRELSALGLVHRRPFEQAFDAFARATDNGAGFLGVWPVLAAESFLRARGGEA